MRVGSKVRTQITTVTGGVARRRRDVLAAEEPLEIRLLDRSGARRTVAVTMRTPGNDFELAAGFLFAEGVLDSRDQIHHIAYCIDPTVDADQRYNIVNVALRVDTLPELPSLERHFYTSSACGVCGKASLDALELRGYPRLPDGPTVSSQVVCTLPDQLRDEQSLFESTGGLHAAALFDTAGRLLCLREDVGRHNAVDKVVGWALTQEKLPLHSAVLLVSGRASYEILQKSTVAGIPIVCAVSAPSHLAVEMARRFNVTLIGFLRGERFNIYHGVERIQVA